jgi:hypothetical protein
MNKSSKTFKKIFTTRLLKIYKNFSVSLNKSDRSDKSDKLDKSDKSDRSDKSDK